jgi:hypothetical protein
MLLFSYMFQVFLMLQKSRSVKKQVLLLSLHDLLLTEVTVWSVYLNVTVGKFYFPKKYILAHSVFQILTQNMNSYASL